MTATDKEPIDDSFISDAEYRQALRNFAGIRNDAFLPIPGENGLPRPVSLPGESDRLS
jgi:hypothetical protein